MLVFVSYISNLDDKLLLYYRQLNFHPTNPSNYALEHVIPAILSKEIYDTDKPEYLFQVQEVITRLQPETINNLHISTIPCENCGHISSVNVFCNAPLVGSPFKIKNMKETKVREVCGLTLCITCISQFGLSGFIKDRCPFHPYLDSNKKATELLLANMERDKKRKTRNRNKTGKTSKIDPNKFLMNRVKLSYERAIHLVMTDKKQFFK